MMPPEVLSGHNFRCGGKSSSGSKFVHHTKSFRIYWAPRRGDHAYRRVVHSKYWSSIVGAQSRFASVRCRWSLRAVLRLIRLWGGSARVVGWGFSRGRWYRCHYYLVPRNYLAITNVRVGMDILCRSRFVVF